MKRNLATKIDNELINYFGTEDYCLIADCHLDSDINVDIMADTLSFSATRTVANFNFGIYDMDDSCRNEPICFVNGYYFNPHPLDNPLEIANYFSADFGNVVYAIGNKKSKLLPKYSFDSIPVGGFYYIESVDFAQEEFSFELKNFLFDSALNGFFLMNDKPIRYMLAMSYEEGTLHDMFANMKQQNKEAQEILSNIESKDKDFKKLLFNTGFKTTERNKSCYYLKYEDFKSCLSDFDSEEGTDF